MVGKEPFSTILTSSTITNQNPPHPNPEIPNLDLDFPCLPSISSPNLSTPPRNPCLNPQKVNPGSDPLSPSPNPWKGKSPNLRHSLTKKFRLRFIPPSSRDSGLVGVCHSEAVAGELKILDLTLVGFFLGRKPGFSHIRSSLLKQWKIRGSVQMLQLTPGGLAFRFSDLEDRDQILETGVYYVSGQPIFFRSWERDIHTGGILGLKQIPLWVSLPGLPLHLWGEDSLSAVCSVLGKPLYSDRITAEKSRWSFARACVEFSGASPLLDSITIEDDVGNVYQQPVKYDWKPTHCISCGIFGHLHDSCKSGPGGTEQPKEDAFGTSNQTQNMPKEDFTSPTNEEDIPDFELGVGKNANRDILNLGKGKTFSELLQERSSMLLRGWIPSRVKKTGSVVQGPTRIRNSSQPLVQKSVLRKVAEHVSSSGAPSGGPSPSCMEKDVQKQSLSPPPLLEKNSNFEMATLCTPPLTNRFGILDLDVDTSPCLHPNDMSLSDRVADQALVLQACSTLGSIDHLCEDLSDDLDSSSQCCDLQSIEGLVTEKVSRAGQGQTEMISPHIGPSNAPCEGLMMNQTRICKTNTHCPSDQNENRPSQTPPNPKPGLSLISSGTRSSSVGRTPYHSRFSKLNSPYKSITDISNTSRISNCLNSNGNDLYHRMATIHDPCLDECPRQTMQEPILTFADATDEDVEENSDEVEDGIEEEDSEESTEEGDDPNGKNTEEEDTAKRKRLTKDEKEDDLWVKTNLNDPRRIRIC